MHVIRLTHVVPRERKRRYYQIVICRDLFGNWILQKEWGRLGNQGDTSEAIFDDLKSLLASLNLKVKEKLQRGYKLNYFSVDGIRALASEFAELASSKDAVTVLKDICDHSVVSRSLRCI
jgi:predicted DNA-binding WGR domain protein